MRFENKLKLFSFSGVSTQVNAFFFKANNSGKKWNRLLKK